jgi:hypothetical protein
LLYSWYCHHSRFRFTYDRYSSEGSASTSYQRGNPSRILPPDKEINMRVAFVSASLGGIDENLQSLHVPQSIDVDFYYVTEKEFPPRPGVISPRLQAKFPKMKAWELFPGYDFYIWADATITLSRADTVEWLCTLCADRDAVFFRHQDKRESIQAEYDFMYAHMNGSTGNEYAQNYLQERYGSEPMREQVEHYRRQTWFFDNRLYSAGLFIYKNTALMRTAFQAWFDECLRWSVQDQLSLPFILAKYSVEVGVIDEEITNNIHTDFHWRNETNVGKWDDVYRDVPEDPSAFLYGDTVTYERGAQALRECETVEDWGTGGGGFKRFRPDAIGIDGSVTPHADKVVDLVYYRSEVDGIFMRHVLEHNREWKRILKNALESARKKLVVVLFTPLMEGHTIDVTGAAEENKASGICVPTLALGKKEFLDILIAYCTKFEIEEVVSETRYGKETIITAIIGEPRG